MATIHRFARQGDADRLRAALEESADPRALANEVDDAGWTPLYYAVVASSPSLDAVRVLLAAGSDPAYARVETYNDDLDRTLMQIFSKTIPSVRPRVIDRPWSRRVTKTALRRLLPEDSSSASRS